MGMLDKSMQLMQSLCANSPTMADSPHGHRCGPLHRPSGAPSEPFLGLGHLDINTQTTAH
eukprot:10544611-Alexandrium_andersonii.AAC.1